MLKNFLMISQTEENYLKAIFKITEKSAGAAALTNAIAAAMQTSAASATDMIKRLSDKNLLTYEKYRGVLLSDEGTRLATQLIRRHRLWEVFLMEKLGFGWDEVHDMAEELEHIPGERLVERLDAFLGHPRTDPHGDPIPDADGRWQIEQQTRLCDLPTGRTAVVSGVADHSPSFLQYLDKMGLKLGAPLEVVERTEYDNSLKIKTSGSAEQILSDKVGQNLLVKIL